MNFIWDLDGTLIDSYDIFVKALEATFRDYGWDFDAAATRRYILKYSSNQFLKEQPIPFDEIHEKFSKYQIMWNGEIQLMEGAGEVLDWTRAQGIQNFLITHKGNNTFTLLNELAIADYFEELITGASGFERKPNPQSANYLIDKYDLDRKSTFYLGDRCLDIDFAHNAGIRSINFLPAENSLQIHKLTDLIEFDFWK
ncbi:MAG: HAD-IA family hydrolase [Streptococcaceae bacterium]|jgi:HAD superfamily hydrolase (TIGR01549 family)|nr:HAD-IA family hydrolase [Streptococcaceae bacterium]